jgi:methyl-accepting chemotaxis protein
MSSPAALESAHAAPSRWVGMRQHWPAALAVLAGLGVASLSTRGAVWGPVSVALACWITWRWGLASRSTGAPAEPDSQAEGSTAPRSFGKPAPEVHRPSGRIGAEVMVSQVVPVWRRQLGMTRTSADEGLQQLLGSFGAMSTALDTLLERLQYAQTGATPGAVEGTVEGQGEAIATLLTPMQRAFDQRDAAVRLLAESADGLTELRQLTRQAREVARHTRLVAFNASIESHRGHAADKGSHAVAEEVRMLAGRISEIAEQMERIVTRVQSPLQQARSDGEIHDTTPEELRLEVELHARTALATMLEALGAGLTGSAPVKQASTALKDELEQAFTHFQFGDRLAQMLDIVGDDMNEFTRWVAQHPQATQNDAAEWLATLEAKYTMEEQRSQHHGNVHIDSGSVIEFF